MHKLTYKHKSPIIPTLTHSQTNCCLVTDIMLLYYGVNEATAQALLVGKQDGDHD